MITCESQYSNEKMGFHIHTLTSNSYWMMLLRIIRTESATKASCI